MSGQEFKHEVDLILDARALERTGMPMDYRARKAWWMTEQGGVGEPAYLLMIGGTEQQREAVRAAARQWQP